MTSAIRLPLPHSPTPTPIHQTNQPRDHYNFANPFVRCPPPSIKASPSQRRGLVRYGSEGDGGKLLCDLSHLEAPCLVYSLGSRGSRWWASVVVV